ncbi:MAG TPA: hypothetical protein VGQ95_02665 [Chthoniobacterales bacterium]|nr:hypothetical protein [Chthoniobacterales bacterium]
MNLSCHSERSGAKRNAVEESLTIVCVALKKPTGRDVSTSLDMTMSRYHVAAA